MLPAGRTQKLSPSESQRGFSFSGGKMLRFTFSKVVRFTPEMRDAIRDYATREEITETAAIRLAIRKLLTDAKLSKPSERENERRAE